jgi:hypothetical protein
MGIFVYLPPAAPAPPPTPTMPVIIEDSSTAPQNVVSQGIFDTSTITTGSVNYNVGVSPLTGNGINNLVHNFIVGLITGSRNIVYGLINRVLLNGLQNRLIGENITITGNRNNTLGDSTTIVGSTNSVVGSANITGGQNVSFGENIFTTKDLGVLLGAGIRASFDRSFVTTSLHSILKRDDFPVDGQFYLRAGTNFNFLSLEWDLKTVQSINYVLPTGSAAYSYKCYLIITSSVGFTGGGRFSLGTLANPTLLFNNQSFSVGGSVGQIEIFETKVGEKLSDIYLRIDSGATGTDVKGRFLIEGFLSDV